MIEKKSLKEWGRDYKISPHFTLKEMACKDGSDLVLYSTDLMAKLEAMRSYVGGTITITSGYRTAAYNSSMKPPGAKNSQHIKGTAADIVVRKDGKVVPAKLICCLAQSLGFRGIGYISATATHVDTRESGSYRGDERRGYDGNVGGDFYRYFGVTDAEVTALMVRPTPTPKPKPAEPEKEEDMTQDQFNRMMDAYLQARAKKAPGVWSKADREWAEANGIVKGSNNGKEYQSFCTREQVAAMLRRFVEVVK